MHQIPIPQAGGPPHTQVSDLGLVPVRLPPGGVKEGKCEEAEVAAAEGVQAVNVVEAGKQ